MATHLPALNQVQVDVLHWIATGCPDGVMTGHTYKQTALALQSRQLVTVKRTRRAWTATVTADGTYYLAHGAYPPQAEFESPQSTPGRRPTTPARPIAAPPKPPTAVRPVDALVEAVVAAGGELLIEPGDHTDYTNLVASANRYAKAPAGKDLAYRYGRNPAIYLVDRPAWKDEVVPPIPVPGSLRGADPSIVDLRESGSPLPVVGQALRNRALRALQAITAECRRHGYDVTVVSGQTRARQQRRTGLLVVTIGGHQIGVSLIQEIDRTPHVPTPAEVERQMRSSWDRPPKYDEHPSDRLRVTLDGLAEHRSTQWRDRARATLEDQLGEVVREIELRAEAAEIRHRERVAEQAERQRVWEAAIEQAREAYTEEARAQALTRQIADWQAAAQIRTFVERCKTTAHPDTSELWLDWALTYADQLDPVLSGATEPVVHEPRREQLQPFLKGWSPYGP